MSQTPILDTMQKAEVVRRAIVAERERHDAEIMRLQKEHRELLTRMAISERGLDQDKIDLARRVIRITGSFERAGDDRELVRREAMQWLSQPAQRIRLFHNYIGTKSYDRWHGQRVSPPYYRVPTHGTVIFSIGLTDAVRDRVPQELTDDEIEAALYVLSRLESVQAAQAEATS